MKFIHTFPKWWITIGINPGIYYCLYLLLITGSDVWQEPHSFLQNGDTGKNAKLYLNYETEYFYVLL